MAQNGPLLLSWLPNTESDLAGYNLYAGRQTGVYTAAGYPIDVGNVTSYVVTITTPGRWYFAVKAYNTAAQESSTFSAEIVEDFIALMAICA